MPEDAQTDEALSGDVLVCPSCLHDNDEYATFCVECRAPVGKYAAIGPWERVFAQTWVYARAAQRPDRFIVVVAMWLVFGPGFVFLPTALMPSGVEWGDWLGWFGATLCAFAWFIHAALLWKTTANYIRGRWRAREETS